MLMPKRVNCERLYYVSFCVGGAFPFPFLFFAIQHRLFVQYRPFLINQSAVANSYANYGAFIYLYVHMYIFNERYVQCLLVK